MLEGLFSTDVYKTIRAVLGPACKADGWKRTKSSAGWYQKIDCGYVSFSLNIVGHGWDDWCGGELDVNFCLCETDYQQPHAIRVGDLHRTLTPAMSHSDALEMLRIQNGVISRRKTPPEDGEPWGAAWDYYQGKRKPLAGPDDAGLEPLAYVTQADVEKWAEFVLERLPRIIDKYVAEWREMRPDAMPRDAQSAEYQPWDAIVAAPESDEPRLVYADWLDEQDDPRGEFIRLQCRLNSVIGSSSPSREETKLIRRMHQLHRTHSESWLSEFSKLPITSPLFRRGFVGEVTITSGQFLKKGDAVLDQLPLLEHIWIKAAAEKFAELSQASAGARVQSVGFSQTRIFANNEGWREWLAAPWPSLRGLDLSRTNYQAGAITRLAASRLLSQLTCLSLANNHMQESIQTIAHSPGMANIRHLDLRGCQLRVKDAEAIATSPTLGLVEELDLRSNTIGNRGVDGIMQSSKLEQLKTLRISHNRTTSKVVDILLRSDLPALKTIELFDNGIADADYARLGERFQVIRSPPF